MGLPKRPFIKVAAHLIILGALVLANHGFAQSSDSEYNSCMALGQKSLRIGDNDEAINQFKRAITLSGNKNYEPYWGLCQAYLHTGSVQNALESGDQLLKLAPDDKWRARAIDIKGLALFQGAENDPNKLAKAEEQFREAVKVNPGLATAHFNLGVTLMKENHDEEGKAELNIYLSQLPNGPEADYAKEYLADPRHAREHFAPNFSGATSQGKYISMDDLHGKVVLVEFWATWCGPCKVAFPELVNMYRNIAKERFVFVSIDEDQNQEVWKQFLAANHPDWLQIHDVNGKIGRQFHPPGSSSGIPDYFVIDGNGVIRATYTGWDDGQAANIRDAIDKCLKTLPPPSAGEE
jgi:tetratricopeptide (TPR) repeat protein